MSTVKHWVLETVENPVFGEEAMNFLSVVTFGVMNYCCYVEWKNKQRSNVIKNYFGGAY
jgi:hypothetical protein